MSSISPVNSYNASSRGVDQTDPATSSYSSQKSFDADLTATLNDLSQNGLISPSDADTIENSQLSFTDPMSLLTVSMLKTASSMQLQVTLNMDKVSASLVDKMKSAAKERLNGAIGSFAIAVGISLAGVPVGLAAGKQLSKMTMENASVKQPIDTSNFAALVMNMGTQFGSSGGQIYAAQDEVSAAGDDASSRILQSVLDQLSQLNPYGSAKQSLN